MVYLPQEITETIVDHVGKYDDFISRQELRNLRLVNKLFSQLATPLLFQTVPFWLGLSSLKHLTLISEHPQMYGVLSVSLSQTADIIIAPTMSPSSSSRPSDL